MHKIWQFHQYLPTFVMKAARISEIQVYS